MDKQVLNNVYHQLSDVQSDLEDLVMESDNRNLSEALGSVNEALMSLSQITDL